MVEFVGVAELTPIETIEAQTVQLADLINQRYQGLINRTVWQATENQEKSNQLADLKSIGVLAASVALTATPNTSIGVEVARSNSVASSVNSRLTLVSDESGLLAVQSRQSAIASTLSNYQPQPYSANLQQLATLSKINGRILGYRGGLWAYWSKAVSDVFEVSAVGGTLERGQGANSNPGFTLGAFYRAPLNTESFDLRGDSSVLDGVKLPAKGLTILMGRQPLIADLATAEVWNASIGGRMNQGSSHVGYVGNANRSSLWSSDVWSFAIGSYQSDGEFTYQLRVKLTGEAPTASWTGGTFQGAGGNESYGSLFALRFGDSN